MTPAQRHNGEDKEILAERKAVYNQAKAITKLSLPNKLEKIGVQALRDCSQVKKVSLPSSLTHIGAEAFWKYKMSYN